MDRAGSMPFETSVFINCPFDADYLPLLRPILFCVLDLGFDARIALERLNSGEPRVEKILEQIRASRYGIHDLSRLKAQKKGEFFRLNMPFELGLDVGARIFGGEKYSTKRCLILEAERYRYQAAISDLSNSDIAVHENEPLEAMRAVRNWLATEAGIRAPGPSAIWGRFIEFMADNYDDLTARGFTPADIEKLEISELIPAMREWCGSRPSS